MLIKLPTLHKVILLRIQLLAIIHIMELPQIQPKMLQQIIKRQMQLQLATQRQTLVCLMLLKILQVPI